MPIVIGYILIVIYLALAGIHICWGLGGKWGLDTAIPTQENGKKVISPGPFECLMVAIGFAGAAVFILIKVGIISINLPHWLSKYGLWILAVIFIARAIGEFKYIGFFKTVRTTRFGQLDTRFYSPLCMFIGFLDVILDLIN